MLRKLAVASVVVFLSFSGSFLLIGEEIGRMDDAIVKVNNFDGGVRRFAGDISVNSGRAIVDRSNELNLISQNYGLEGVRVDFSSEVKAESKETISEEEYRKIVSDVRRDLSRSVAKGDSWMRKLPSEHSYTEGIEKIVISLKNMKSEFDNVSDENISSVNMSLLSSEVVGALGAMVIPKNDNSDYLFNETVRALEDLGKSYANVSDGIVKIMSYRSDVSRERGDSTVVLKNVTGISELGKHLSDRKVKFESFKTIVGIFSIVSFFVMILALKDLAERRQAKKIDNPQEG